MINVALYSHTIDFAGTWRSHERIAEILQSDPRFKVSIFYSTTIEHNRLDEAKKVLSNCKFVDFERSHQKTSSNEGWQPISNNISSITKENDIQIFHFARSGYYEWPFTSRIAPVQIETNIFGYRDNSPFLDGTIFIGKCLGLQESPTSILLPNPIPTSTEYYGDVVSLRRDLNISDDAIVFGRVGRPANFTPISLIAYEAFKRTCKKDSKYLIMGGCNEAKNCVEQLSLKNDVIFIECTNDDKYIERFHKTIDVFAHYRSDGEICSTAIAQAMMHGIPVITHTAGKNGQVEWLGPGGFFARNPEDYYKAMMAMSDDECRNQLSSTAKKFAVTNFDQKTIVDKVVGFYLNIARSKNCEF